MVESRSCVQREGVYRWFSGLSSAQRAEFLCGLLDLCVPIELRFLGSCLEDLARKDYRSLRDAEIKANNAADLSGLADVTDEAVRSKLLVSLALLGSDSREAAGVLYRTLTHIDAVIDNYGLALNDGRTDEQFLLLFTMACNHPAFSFHQKQVLRQQLGHIQDILQASRGGGGGASAEPGSHGAQPHHHQTSSVPLSASTLHNSSAPYLPTCYWHKNQNREASAGPGASGGEEPALQHDVVTCLRPERRSPPPPPPPPLQNQDPPARRAGTAVIDRLVLRRVKSENGSDYGFEVGWADGFTSSVVRTQPEVAELISQLSQVFPDDGLEKFLPPSREVDTSVSPRCLTALPSHVLQHPTVQRFFASSRPLSPGRPSTPPSVRSAPPPSFPSVPACPLSAGSNPGCTVQYRGANRAVYRVASVQPVVSSHSSVSARSPPRLSSLPLRSPAAGGGEASTPLHHAPLLPSYQHRLHPPTAAAQPGPPSLHPLPLHRSQSHPAQPAPTQAGAPEQNAILDWLRKLRLHKYYPVFKQLTMEEFLALTEEDLNKYDLTQGAKKKLKTQLELQKSADREMKMEKRPCSGIARVTPSSHMGVSAHPPSAAGELRVEADGAPPPPPPHLMPTDSSPPSGYAGSSPWTPPCCDSAFDRSRDPLGRVLGVNPPGGAEKDRLLLTSGGSGRPTAQVLPVQTDPAPAPPHPPSCSSHLPFGLLQTPYHAPQPGYPPPAPHPPRVLSSPRKPRPSPFCADDRTKPLGGGAFGLVGVGVGVAARLESQFSGLNVDTEPAAAGRGRPVGGAVETSSALTSTSNSLHHVSQPPLLFHLSSSPSGSHAHPAASSDSSACVCSSCGCRGDCGAYGASPGYAAAGYLQPSLFTLGPLLHLSPLLAASGATGTGAPPFSYPVMVPPPLYRQSRESHDAPQGFGFYQVKRAAAAGNASCYNCGGGGHRADDCKQPPMDAAPQGTFRLRFAPHPQSKDSAD